MVATTTLASLLVSAFLVSALPHEAQHTFADDHHDGPINPLKHLSAISPFYIPTEQPTPLPEQCKLTRVSLLIRHSSILGNDDEFEETMEPFITKIKKLQKKGGKRGKKGKREGVLPKKGDWAFLRDWKSPIVEDKLEKLSERGRQDAEDLGKYFRHQYDPLFPPPYKTGKNSSRIAHKVWTASSERDIITAKAYINGSFPSHQSGDGTGDGEVVQLVQVPNHSKEPMGWEQTLTPHKACAAFEKKSSLGPANEWLSVMAPNVRKRLSDKKLLGKLAKQLTDQDVLAMGMLCGYETIASGDSPFCHLFTDNEWRDIEYYFDVRYHYMMGYGNYLTPYLGAPWVNTAKHLLEGEEGDAPGKHLPTLDEFKENLPAPKVPPNATHTQTLHPHFTHRESPAFVAVFLNLFNDTSLPNPSSIDPALDHRPLNRQWRTSHLVSFLGNIALERFECEPETEGGEVGEYVRAMVNGREKVMGGCEDGVGGSCKWESWKNWLEERNERWGDWASVCEKKKD